MTVERILIADADRNLLNQIAAPLVRQGYEVLVATSADELLHVAKATPCDVALIELGLPGTHGLDAARHFTAVLPDALVILTGDAAELNEHYEELLASHYSFLQKPVSPGQVLLAVEQASELRRLREENRTLRQQWEDDEGPEDFVSHSPRMIEALRQAATLAENDDPVLIYGPPGTEKEIVALYIHRCSRRSERPFVPFECGRVTGTTEEAELFGREYPGRDAGVWRGRGRIELAAGGTLFLDNITELSPACQAKLLRFIEEGKFHRAQADRFGLATPRTGRHPAASRANVRILCASSHDLHATAGAGRLREDLLFRLGTLSIAIPPLAERREDILPLARRFLRRFAAEAPRPVCDLTDEAAKLLEEYDWPGNVAELKDTIRTAVLGAQHELLVPEDLLRGPSRRVISGVIGGVTGPSLEDAERQLILQTLHETGGNKARAARRLCITTTTLCHKLARYRSHGLLEKRRTAAREGSRKC